MFHKGSVKHLQTCSLISGRMTTLSALKRSFFLGVGSGAHVLLPPSPTIKDTYDSYGMTWDSNQVFELFDCVVWHVLRLPSRWTHIFIGAQINYLLTCVLLSFLHQTRSWKEARSFYCRLNAQYYYCDACFKKASRNWMKRRRRRHNVHNDVRSNLIQNVELYSTAPLSI